jgi:hypothetical protein
MRERAATLAAALLAVAVYVSLAWLARGIDIPAGVPTASLPWISPYRVVATTGFLIASAVGASHLAGDFAAAVLLGGILGAVFAVARKVMGG